MLIKKPFATLSSLALLCAGSLNLAIAAERPTMNKTRDPRPDILAHPLYYAHTEYRREYNRPRMVPGWIAAQIAPTSQEAMVWYENLQAGNYNGKDCPPVYKSYYYPKPWEVLLTGPRPDFATAANSSSTQRSSAANVKNRAYNQTAPAEPSTLQQVPNVPEPVKLAPFNPK